MFTKKSDVFRLPEQCRLLFVQRINWVAERDIQVPQQQSLLRRAHHCQKFGFGQLGRVVCQIVIRGFAVDENLRRGAEACVVGKQTGVDVVIVADLHEQVRAAFFAEAALRPFGR